MDLFDRILALSQEGFFCAQIMMLIALESEGRENPDLIRAMGGLTGSMGFSGGVCGCLTGGACILSYFLGKGEADELEDPDVHAAVGEFVTWFQERAVQEYGGSNCQDITHNLPAKRLEHCPALMGEALETCFDILAKRGVI